MKQINNLSKREAWNKGIHFVSKGSFKKGKPSWNKGMNKEEYLKHYSHDFKGENNPMFNKISHRKGKTLEEEYGVEKANEIRLKQSKIKQGKIVSEEQKRKVSLANKGKRNSPEAIEKFRLWRRTQILPVKDTSIEIKIQDFLKQLGIEFFTHQYIQEIKHNYQCDIFIPSLKTIIECDGDFWHGNPRLFKDREMDAGIIRKKELDEIRTKELLEKGFRVIRLWGSEIEIMNLNNFREILV